MKDKNSWRHDGYLKVTGKAKYTDDLKVLNMVHAVPVYSDYVHAQIISIDYEKAMTVSGVLRVITAKDILGLRVCGQIIKDYQFFADERILCHGDVVAMVVAETREIAIEAAKLITVRANELPQLIDPEEAMKPDAVPIHPERENNIINTHHVRRGDTEKGFKESDIIIEKQFTTQWVEHAYLEPESALCIPRADGVMEVYGSMQHPFSTRRFVATILGTTLSDVEIKGIPMGGGFGGKDDTAALVCARAALAARILNRPVKMTYTREWSVRESYKRHPYKIYYKMGLSKAGIIKAVETKIIADGGAYCSVTPWVTWRSTVQCCGPYLVENVHCDTYGVYTNNTFTGAFRGFGSPQMNFVIEQMVEIASEQLVLDPIELRRINMVKQDSVTITGQKLDTHTVSMSEVLDKTISAIDYNKKINNCSRGKTDKDEYYGIGLAMSYRGVSLGAEGMDFNCAIINVQFDGSILLEVAVHENGQGAESAMILILAEELGVSKERIRYRQASTSAIPDGGTTVASRGTIMGGGAVVEAAKELKQKINQVVASKFNCNPNTILYKDSKLYTAEGQVVEFNEVMRWMYLAQEFPYAFGTFKAPKVSWDEETGQGDAYFTWVYSCNAVEVRVNKKTNKVIIDNMVAVHDIGRVINKDMLIGQIYGGLVMGAGYGLLEEIIHKEGKIQNLNYHNYRVFRANDLPEMTAILVENRDPVSPSGAKSIGEPALEIIAPAIANAVYNATGKRILSLPIQPHLLSIEKE